LWQGKGLISFPVGTEPEAQSTLYPVSIRGLLQESQVAATWSPPLTHLGTEVTNVWRYNITPLYVPWYDA